MPSTPFVVIFDTCKLRFLKSTSPGILESLIKFKLAKFICIFDFLEVCDSKSNVF